ncbi:MAG TPA: cystathionine beta-lyase [Usitatibacteraceae bacterium]|nr:cystathionine beta-lyase [Usitatibacteraceae bacterium]
MNKDTLLTRLGREVAELPETINVPLQRASTVLFDSLAHRDAAQRRLDADEPASTYGLFNLPQIRALEDAVAAIEGGYRALTFSSGLAAIAGALLALTRSGDHVLVPDSAYAPTRHLCDHFLRRFGVATTYYDPCIGAGIAGLMHENTRVVYTESPGSHTFEVQDLPAIAAAAHAKGAKVILDNAWATGYFFDGFAHGADLVVQPATKYYAGHSDVLIGLVVANEEAWPLLKATTYDLGQRASPDDCFLTLRGLRTLGVRLTRHQQSALEIARWLAARPEVARVLHPALPGDAGHALWRRDFTGAGGLFAIELNASNPMRLAAMVDHYELFGIGYSWGGFESLVMPAQLVRTATRMPAGPLVRYQIGLEDPADLIRDLEAGFARLAA